MKPVIKKRVHQFLNEFLVFEKNASQHNRVNHSFLQKGQKASDNSFIWLRKSESHVGIVTPSLEITLKHESPTALLYAVREVVDGCMKQFCCVFIAGRPFNACYYV